MKLNTIIALIAALLICCYDFFTRLYISDIEVNTREINSFNYEPSEKNGNNIDSFLSENFKQLVEEQQLKEKRLIAKLEKKNNAEQSKKQEVVKKEPPSYLKVVGTLTKNNQHLVVIEVAKSKQENKIYTLKVGDAFPYGKVISISALGATIDVKGQRYSLPIFKDKNIQVKG